MFGFLSDLWVPAVECSAPSIKLPPALPSIQGYSLIGHKLVLTDERFFSYLQVDNML